MTNPVATKPISDTWARWNERSKLQNAARWLDWRITKKFARLSGRKIKRSVPMFWGERITIVYPEYVSGFLGKYGYFERDLTAAVVDLVEPGDTFYDVGAHFGFYSVLAADLVGSSGAVHSFEPTPQTYEVLSENADRRENIQSHNLAVFDEPKSIQFWEQSVRDSSLNFVVGDDQCIDRDKMHDGWMIEVQAVRLDDFAKTHGTPDVIKLDVEGVESFVLRGMNGILERSRPVVMMEVGDNITEKTGNVCSRENVDYLLERGYVAWTYGGKEPQQHIPQETYHAGNLVFVHELSQRQPGSLHCSSRAAA